jgi:membrane protease subunit (stomatin/prohibitin family)
MMIATIVAYVVLELNDRSSPVLLTVIVPIIAGVLISRSNNGLSQLVSASTHTTNKSATNLAAQMAQMSMAIETLQRDVAVLTKTTNGDLQDRISVGVRTYLDESKEVGNENNI